MAGPFYNQRSSNSSRSSLRTMQTMSIITQYSDAYNPGALPKGPLRVPQKHPRRSAGPGYGPSPYVNPEPTAEVDVLPSKEVEVLPTKEGGSDGTEAPPAPRVEESTSEDEERGWFAHRKRSSRFLIIVGVAAVVIVGLAVGLSVGLRRSGTTASPSDGPRSIFPAGSYAVKTSLHKTSTKCTSRSSTWNCEPFDDDDSTTLYWDIASHGPSAFTISSKQNPLTPPFSDVSLELVDGNRPTERLVFSLPTTKVVVPSDGATPANRAAKCQYRGVVLQGTLYTRRRDGRAISAPGQQEQHAAWPGDIEISQVLNSTIGQPTCLDDSGTQIADVQAAQGSCECSYSNED
ncbi:tat pathway signal sequence [Hirsutella rhossiliensis]|uniref:Tat pathway signal sequence n=1 Tax=Hirsutella rhossiliensis TaxID=111463 RepID=A0A9P8MM77_9HYPO|nr:tat pathway signal sequence [Hirsutella rhossiliensis]KAH0957893.1 tat pathway signal sequence [Hirsutella rhossiliensis]